MRDKRCNKCKYHTTLSGHTGDDSTVACMYAAYSGKGTALKVVGDDNHKLKDTRGKRGTPCKLFEEGRYERPPRFMGRSEEKEWYGTL